MRDAIRTGSLVPEVLYSVYQLADQLEVSRSPVRDARLRLEQAGLVRFERNEGFRVLLPASGIALINSLGNAAGFVSPYAFGWIQDASSGNNALSMIVMIAANLLALTLVLTIYRRRRRSVGSEPHAASVTTQP